MPEQVWNYPDVPASPYGSDPATASIGFTDGQPDGSAAPLTWAQAQLLRLIADLPAGRLVEQPSIVAARYLPGGASGRPAPLAVTAPLAVSGGNVPAEPDPAVGHRRRRVGAGHRARTAPGATVRRGVTGTAPGAAAPATTITTRDRGLVRRVLGDR